MITLERVGNTYDNGDVGMTAFLQSMLRAKALIAGIVGLTLLLGVAYAILATPIYRADVLLQIEDQQPAISGMEGLDILTGDSSASETAIELIHARSTLKVAIEALNLDIIAKPLLFPLIGNFVFRHYSDNGLAQPLLNLGGYCWGGQRISVTRLNVPESFSGEPLLLTAVNNTSYTLHDNDGHLLLKGTVGKLTEQQGFQLLVNDLYAHPGDSFVLSREYYEDALDALSERVSVAEEGKQTGILRLSVTGEDRSQNILLANKLAEAYIARNLKKLSQKTQNALDFLYRQLPVIRKKMEQSEQKLNAFRLKKGSVNLEIETQAILQQIVSLEEQQSALDVKKAEMGQMFTGRHTVIQSLLAKEQRLRADKAKLEKQIKDLPATQQELLRLSRDVKVSSSLYTLMLNKVQELEVVRAGIVPDVYVVDEAFSRRQPVAPKRVLVVVGAMVLGFCISLFVVLLLHAFYGGVEDPTDIEKLGLSVYAMIPHASVQNRLDQKMIPGKKHVSNRDTLLFSHDPLHISIEALRSFRTNLRFSMSDAKNNILMLTGPSPGVGKSFISANLSALLAHSDFRILVIDADMRKGHLHRYFACERGQGLSELLSGQASLNDVLQQHTALENLSLISRGKAPPNPAELLSHPRFDALLQKCSGLYDFVIIDTPPVLAVTDPVIIGKYAGMVVMVLRSGMHQPQDILRARDTLEKAGVALNGAILNDAGKHSLYGYHGYRRQGYQYTYDYQPET